MKVINDTVGVNHEYTPKWKDVKLHSVDLKTKWAEVDTHGSFGDIPFFHLKNGLDSGITEIQFPNFKGYDVFSYTATRYTLNIVFGKKN